MPANVIAIDGPAASGKSSVAELLAEILRIPYVSTGNMYRAVTYFVLQNWAGDVDFSDDDVAMMLSRINLEHRTRPDGKLALSLNGADIEPCLRSPEVSSNVSRISAIPAVRQWLIDQQRGLARIGMIVMEGRDIGTVVFPDARHKFFLTATPEVRAERRLIQGGEVPAGATVQAVAREIAERDRKDMNRRVAPLKKADDALLVDSSGLSVEQVVRVIIKHINGTRKEDSWV